MNSALMAFFRFICILLIFSLIRNEFLFSQELPPGWDYKITNLFHPIAIPLSANPSLFGDSIAPGDHIGVFFIRNDSLICAGASVWPGNENIAVVAFGDDNMTPLKDGFYVNETIKWKIYSWDFETDFIATVTYDPAMPNSNGKFYPGGLSALTSIWYGIALEISAQASPDTTCVGNTSQLSASASGGTGSYMYAWTSIPEGFTSNEPNPVVLPLQTTSYILQVQDEYNIAFDTTTVTVVQLPQVFAGNDTAICENGLVYLDGVVSDAQTNLWMTDGDGAFTDSTMLVTTYLPGPLDKEDGLVKLTLQAYPMLPCQGTVTDFIFISLNPLPAIDAGADDAICAGDDYIASGLAENTAFVEWSSLGDGLFDNPFYLGATYFPGEEDIQAGEAVLTLSGYPVSPCTDVMSDTLILTIHPLPEVNAGVDHWIPYGTSTQLNSTVTGGSDEYLYAWIPEEYLLDPTEEDPLTTNLYQSTAFVLTGTDAVTMCYNTDTAIVIITGGPLSVVASANPEYTCTGSPTQLIALPGGGSGNYSFIWTSDPPGFNSELQNPLAFPEATTVFTVTVDDGFNTAEDGTAVDVYTPPEAFSGEDITIPFGTSTVLSGSATGGSGIFSFRWAPAQYLVDPAVSQPVTINLTQSVEFILTMTDLITECDDSDSATVFVVGGPLQVIASATPATLCQGESSQLGALASGGSGIYTFAWTSYPPGFSSDHPNPVVLPEFTTDYFIQVSDGYSDATDYVTVEVYPIPSVDIDVFPDDTVCAGETVWLDASTPGGIGYYWLPGGQTTPAIQIDSSGIGFGSKTLTVFVTTLDGCTGVDSVDVIFFDCTGIVEAPYEHPHLFIYPNPGSEKIVVGFKAALRSDMGSKADLYILEMIDLMGHKVYQSDHLSGDLNHSIALESFPQGLYLLLLKRGDLIISTGKVIVGK